MAMDTQELTSILLPYQAEYVWDQSPVIIYEKSRRIGLSWGEAAASVLDAAASKAAGGMDCWYIGYNKDMAEEFIRDCANWAKSFNEVCDDVSEEIITDEGKDILTYVIRFASGFRIIALSSRPSNLRGKQGRVILDEAAFHDNLDELIKAAFALLIWGGKVRIISTHDGEENPFNLLIKECRAGKKPYKVYRTTFREALSQGLYKRICAMKGLEWTQEKEDAWAQEIYDFYGDGAAEELDVIPSAGGGVYINRMLVERCQHPDSKVVRLEKPDDFVTNPERTRIIDDWLKDTIKPLIDAMPGKRTVFGQDFGRSGDLSVQWLMQQESPTKYHTPFLIELRNIPFDCQEQITFYLLDNVPLFFHGKFDSRGNGQSLAEKAMQRYGESRIDCVMLSRPWYNQFFPKYKAALESKLITVPESEDVVADHRRVILDKGQPKMDDGRDKGSDGKWRHGDTAVAGVLVNAATLEEGEPAAGVNVPKAENSMNTRPSRLQGRTRAGGLFRRAIGYLAPTKKVTLQYFNGSEWIFIGNFRNEQLAWISLGGDDFNYRTINESGQVLTDKSG